MEQFIFLVGVIALFAANALISWVLAYLLTEVTHLPWNVKPFNCRGCLSFWLTFAIGTALAFVVTPYITTADKLTVRTLLVCLAFLSGFINYLKLKLKFRIYD